MPKQDDLDVVAFVTIKLHSNGSMAVAGNIGDKALALSMLDSAKDAVRGQFRNDKELIAIPNRDVVAQQHPNYPTRAFGDMKPEDRGDMP